MNHFKYKKDELFCENVSIKEIAGKVGTPFYLYSYQTLLNHYKVFDQAFAKTPHLVCFAMKSNSNLSVLKTFINQGAGVDIVSGGELYRALLAGADPQKIVYAGVGKTIPEIKYALKQKILMFNVESEQELLTLNETAGKMRIKARIALRVNPNIDAQTHAYISTGLKKNKFGIDIKEAIAQYQAAGKMKNLEIIGVHIHIGSQITQLSPFIEALKKLIGFVQNLKEAGIAIKYINIGGGLGITYKDEQPPHPKEFAKQIVPLLKKTKCTVILEPGRVLVGNAGILVCGVTYYKKGAEKNFVVSDAGMNDLIRPALYNSYQNIIPVNRKNQEKKCLVDVVGPICESGDFLAKDRNLPEVKQGDLLAVMSAGAYGFTMSSQYNSRPRVTEVLVKDKKFFVIRKRESYADLVKGEEIATFLKP